MMKKTLKKVAVALATLIALFTGSLVIHRIRVQRITSDGHRTKTLPGRFRTMYEAFKRKMRREPSRHGLERVRASGSQQFSSQELAAIKDILCDYDLIVLDLRKEAHGFIEGEPNWFFQKICEHDGDAAACVLQKKRIICAESEKSVACKLGVEYRRLNIKDQHIPLNPEVDEFVRIIDSLKPTQWLHAHCWWGLGRTTIILALYDMLMNAHEVSFTDIINRQWALGGHDLWQNSRKISFLKKFYCYARARHAGYRGTWSEWSTHKTFSRSELRSIC